ncbi:hypothetical protein C5167_006348 [Papaver somniferum]|uniref:Phytocyanin domain-containing protein n=1 Tax=Papaver somniferum TaxID=3469 RepID=A0A4Y7JG97_PAPSO|nr:early nodulin-like protein 1 [Papaver somniferum]RZC59040.1 hypothetical protein C5167_006348 [Papaver somniferum]
MAISPIYVGLSTSLVLVNLIISSNFSEAKDFLVGGKSNGWEIPSSPQSQPLNHWAQSSRFQLGDSLVWEYETGKDSVLQVTRENYLNCVLTKPVAEYKDGENTKVELNKSGPYYFISGAKGHCEKGQKLIVVVMAPRSTAPAPSPVDAPAVSPTSGATTISSSSRFGGVLLMGLGIALVV